MHRQNLLNVNDTPLEQNKQQIDNGQNEHQREENNARFHKHTPFILRQIHNNRVVLSGRNRGNDKRYNSECNAETLDREINFTSKVKKCADDSRRNCAFYGIDADCNKRGN